MFALRQKPIILNICINNKCIYFSSELESSEDTINKEASNAAAKPICSQDVPHLPTSQMYLLVCSSCFLNWPLLARLSATCTSEALRLVPLGGRPQRPVSLMKPDKCVPRLWRTRTLDGITRQPSTRLRLNVDVRGFAIIAFFPVI